MIAALKMVDGEKFYVKGDAAWNLKRLIVKNGAAYDVGWAAAENKERGEVAVNMKNVSYIEFRGVSE
ncbi:hypothetical protein [Salibacterium lacus]|uniref:Uncharacterized protein n=1 Tax=Salibacterium lacus TaxID=1898109 RepID=A0ABW5SY52_9BACI